jgi:hypothetical protein
VLANPFFSAVSRVLSTLPSALYYPLLFSKIPPFFFVLSTEHSALGTFLHIQRLHQPTTINQQPTSRLFITCELYLREWRKIEFEKCMVLASF